MSKCLYGALLASAMLATPVLAQSNPPAPSAAPRATSPAPMAQSSVPMAQTGHWRASKLIGVNVYNEQNEKLGDINEILLDKSGRVQGVIIGVGGFLGMGEHDVLVSIDKLKWVNEPMKPSTTAMAPAPNTTGTNVPTRSARSASERWYPDHAVLSATKEQLKAMQAFRYN